MPSSRRRRFSVQNEIANRPTPKTHKATQISHLDPDLEKISSQNVLGVKNIKFIKNRHPNTSKRSFMLEVLTESKTSTSTETTLENTSSDKEITASSSNIDLFALSPVDSLALSCSKFLSNIRDYNQKCKKTIEGNKTGNNRTEIISRRDKYTHRIKVRSPKRRAPVVIDNHIISNTKTIAIDALEWGDDFIEKNEEEIEIEETKQTLEATQNTEEEVRVSSHSIEEMCRICHSGEDSSHDLGRLISACGCRGTVGRVHIKCLERWLTESGKSSCELCGTNYVTKRVHKFGLLKALIMWILSNNSKHMIVDIFGIMIMTPIAVVAAGLTGRTFAGLMAQDQMTPWPLASTFVLACMTLVCYYCWIVSALTRHALAWWIWYRSHYEVRLQLQEDELSPPSINNDQNVL